MDWVQTMAQWLLRYHLEVEVVAADLHRLMEVVEVVVLVENHHLMAWVVVGAVALNLSSLCRVGAALNQPRYLGMGVGVKLCLCNISSTKIKSNRCGVSKINRGHNHLFDH